MIQIYCCLKGVCIFLFFFFIFVFACNPSPFLPRQHSSSPCKLSCSEPQRALLSVELRILNFFNMFASMFLAFSKLCLASISCIFFNPFPAFLRFFKIFPVNFLIFPTISSISLVFPSLPFIFSSSLIVFSTIFLHCPPFPPCF